MGESCSYVLKVLNPDEDTKLLKALFQFSINIERECVCENVREIFLVSHVKYMSRFIYKMPRMKG